MPWARPCAGRNKTSFFPPGAAGRAPAPISANLSASANPHVTRPSARSFALVRPCPAPAPFVPGDAFAPRVPERRFYFFLFSRRRPPGLPARLRPVGGYSFLPRRERGFIFLINVSDYHRYHIVYKKVDGLHSGQRSPRGLRPGGPEGSGRTRASASNAPAPAGSHTFSKVGMT